MNDLEEVTKRVATELANVRLWEETVASARDTLRRDETSLANARRDLAKAKAELYDAFPELLPDVPVVDTGDWQPPGDGSGFQPVEVDDPDDVPDFRESPGQR